MKHYNELKHTFDHFLDDPSQPSPHASEVAHLLKKIHQKDKAAFHDYLTRIPNDILGDILLELPEKIKDEAIAFLPSKELADAVDNLDSDDAADLINDIDDVDEDKREEVFSRLDEENQEDIDKLRSYSEDQAGAWMQTELFKATLDETIQHSIDRLKELKKNDELTNVHQVFIVNEHQRLIATVSLENLILYDFSQTYQEVVTDQKFRYVEATDNIEDVASMFEQYDLSVLPVLDYQGRLVGRITSDDIYDVIEERATDQIYNLAGVNDDIEQEEDFFGVFKNRAIWLSINLATAIVASIVISMFDATLAAFVPLAILMPIVASMGGNAGTQTLTVMVRQMALGDIDLEHSKEVLKKEVFIALLNGMLFAVIMGIIAYLWFDMSKLGIVIALAMIINLFIAGFFGAAIPLVLKRLNIDPAIGSTVILTTATDVFGFLSFLGLASIILM